jgi:hypothetical protein
MPPETMRAETDVLVIGDIYGLLGRLDGCVSQKAEFMLGNAQG